LIFAKAELKIIIRIIIGSFVRTRRSRGALRA
jgi:hypothetical protein